ncbi:ABC transporter substrate-binding protein [Nocardiopsis salina]|uniref:ABC transporter substrate-binding protein n=1 Tax=Nocardiopsis salina TaxID=245836 RepID=UPI0003458D89|nr:ABC transporter substrate-binding protein [Nocardiopsis salina]
MRVDRRTLIGAGLGTALTAGLGGAATAGVRGLADQGSGRALRVGYLPITDASPLLVAHHKGLYERFGVDVESPVRFRGWAELAQAFVTGRVDVVHLLAPFAVQLRYGQGTPVRSIAWNHTNGSALTLADRLDDLGGLAGRTFAVPYWWSIHNILAQRLMRQSGLTPVLRRSPSAADGEVRLVVMSPSDMLPAMANGVIGGYVVADPFNAMAEIQGVGRIHRFLGDLWRDHACCVVSVLQPTIDEDPDRIQRLTEALTTAQLEIEADRASAAQDLTSGYLPQPLPAVERALGYEQDPYQDRGAVLRPQWEGQSIGFAPYPFADHTRTLVEFMDTTLVDVDTRFLEGIDPADVHGELFDESFARRAIENAGGPSAFGLDDGLTRREEVDTA